MKDVKITSNDVASIMVKVADDVRGHADELREIDAAIGDGDLGVTVTLGANAIAGYFSAPDETDIGKMLLRCGMNINRANPSTFGTLLSSAFLGAGKAVQGKQELTPDDMVNMGSGAIESILKRGRAKVGDKTMLDSLVPAFEAFKKGLAGKKSLTKTLEESVRAAEAGMKATADMKARVGRASYRQDGTIGVRDGGAVAMYYIIESFVRHTIAALAKM